MVETVVMHRHVKSESVEASAILFQTSNNPLQLESPSSFQYKRIFQNACSFGSNEGSCNELLVLTKAVIASSEDVLSRGPPKSKAGLEGRICARCAVSAPGQYRRVRSFTRLNAFGCSTTVIPSDRSSCLSSSLKTGSWAETSLILTSTFASAGYKLINVSVYGSQ